MGQTRMYLCALRLDLLDPSTSERVACAEFALVTADCRESATVMDG